MNQDTLFSIEADTVGTKTGVMNSLLGTLIYHTLHYNVKKNCHAEPLQCTHTYFLRSYFQPFLVIYNYLFTDETPIYRSSTVCSCVSGQFKMDDNNGNTSSETHFWKSKLSSETFSGGRVA